MKDHDPASIADKPAITQGNEFKLERYKYILGQLHYLNKNVSNHLILFQKLSALLVAAGAAVFVSWRKFDIDAEAAKVAINSLLATFLLFAGFVILSLVAGILSWFDYRKEEVALLDTAVSPGFRAKPRFRNLFRWHETYVIAFMVLVSIAASIFVQVGIIPLIN